MANHLIICGITHLIIILLLKNMETNIIVTPANLLQMDS
jgi:hypothetical protein